MLGFQADHSKGLSDIKAAATCRESLMYPAAVGALLTYYGFLLPLHGNGQVKLDVIAPLLADLIDYDVYGGLNLVALGAFEQLKGNITKSIELHKSAIPSLKHLGKLHLACYGPLALNHALLCDWRQALNYFDRVLSKKKIAKVAPTLTSYLYAMLYSMAAADEETNTTERDRLHQLVHEHLTVASELQGHATFLWKHVFYVPIVLSRARQFKDSPKSWPLPAMEVLYLGNAFYMIHGQQSLVGAFLDRVSREITTIERDTFEYTDQYLYLLFMKGICLKHLEKEREARVCFKEVIDRECELEYFTELPAQAAYELGLAAKAAGSGHEANVWFDKVNSYVGYATEKIIKTRTRVARRGLHGTDKFAFG